MTPIEAFDDLVAGDAEHAPPSAMDYTDSTQIARAVLVDGERWIVLLRKAGE